MNAPSKQIPDGLDPVSYARLAIQYYFMGWNRHSIKAGKLALRGSEEEQSPATLSRLSEDERGRFRLLVEGLSASVTIGDQFMTVSRTMTDYIQDGLNVASQVTDDLLSGKKHLRTFKYALEVSLGELGKIATEAVTRAADEMVRASQPPREVPAELPARQLVILAERYLTLGWTEQARDALELAISLGPTSLVGKQAKTILLTRLPKQPVPYIACEGLIEARRALVQGDMERSRVKLTELIRRYPGFESPYNELGMINLRDGEIELARNNVTMAIEINPNYLDAWLNLARINAAACQLLDAQRCLDRASALDDTDDRIVATRQMISLLARL